MTLKWIEVVDRFSGISLDFLWRKINYLLDLFSDWSELHENKHDCLDINSFCSKTQQYIYMFFIGKNIYFPIWKNPIIDEKTNEKSLVNFPLHSHQFKIN